MKRFVILLTLAVGTSAKLPSSFQKCIRRDANFNKCLKRASENGILQMTRAFPEANLPCGDPLQVAALTIAPGSKGIVAFRQNFKDCQLYGISKLQMNNITFNFELKNIYIDATIGNLTMQCYYKFNGKILLLPIVGEGSSTTVLSDLNLILTLDWEESKTRGQTFMKFVSSNLTLNPSLLELNFRNLFNRIKGMGDNINKVLNENWRDVYADIRGGYENAIGLILMDLFNNFFSQISMEDAFD